MGSVPTPRTFVAGEVETATFMNSLGAVLNFLQNPPRVRCTQGTGTSLVNNSGTVVNFDTETYDTDNMHSPSTNPNRLTANTPGLYTIRGRVGIVDNTVGDRFVQLRKNGTEFARSEGGHLAGTNNIWCMEASDEVYLAAGDYVDMVAYQNTGAAVTTSTGSYTSFSARWVAVS